MAFLLLSHLEHHFPRHLLQKLQVLFLLYFLVQLVIIILKIYQQYQQILIIQIIKIKKKKKEGEEEHNNNNQLFVLLVNGLWMMEIRLGEMFVFLFKLNFGSQNFPNLFSIFPNFLILLFFNNSLLLIFTF